MMQSTALPVIDLKRIKDARDAELLASLPTHIHDATASIPEPPSVTPNMPPQGQPAIVAQQPSVSDGGTDPRLTQADALTKQAAPPPGPKGLSQNLASAVGHFADALGNPKDYQQIELQKQGTERQREQDLLARAQQLRGESTQAANTSFEHGRQSGQDYRQQQQDTQTQEQTRFENARQLRNDTSKQALEGAQTNAANAKPTATFHDITEGGKGVVMGPDGKVIQTIEGNPKAEKPTTEVLQFSDYMKHPDLVAKYGGDQIGFSKYKDAQKVQNDITVGDALSQRQAARDSTLQQIKDGAGAEAQKTQAIGAVMTQAQIDNIRQIVAKKPQLVGAVAGRLEDASHGLGTTFGMQNPEDEHDAAMLANSLGNLVVNEARTGFARSSPQAAALIKSFSAQLKDNPNMLSGFLDGADSQSNIALQALKENYRIGPGPRDANGQRTTPPAVVPGASAPKATPAAPTAGNRKVKWNDIK